MVDHGGKATLAPASDSSRVWADAESVVCDNMGQ